MNSALKVNGNLAVTGTILQPCDREISWTLSNTDERGRLIGSQHRLAVPLVLDGEWRQTGEGVRNAFSDAVVLALIGGRDCGHVRDSDRHVRAVIRSTGTATRIFDFMDSHCVITEGEDVRRDLEVVEVGVDQRKMYYIFFTRVVMLDVNRKCERSKSRKLDWNDTILSSDSRVQAVFVNLVRVQERRRWTRVDSLP